MSIKFCSLNVRGLRDSMKRRKLFLWLRRKQFDIYFLQETHSTKNDENIWRNEWGAKALFTHSFSNKTGCGFLFSNRLDLLIDNITRDGDGRFLIITIKLNDEQYTLVNLYCPNKDDPLFFQNVFDTLNAINTNNGHLILGGNFNFVQDLDLDKIGRRVLNFRQSRYKLQQFLIEENLVDIWRIRHPGEKKFTWQRRDPEIFCRLDYFFYPFNKVFGS